MASTIKNIGKSIVIVTVVIFASCTKYGYIDGGIANGVHDCTMWEYFHTDSYNWDSTIILIEHAGLKSLFDGTGEYKQITFFGLTGPSIRRYLLENNYERVTDIPKGKCVDILQKLVVPQRLMLKDIPRGNRVNRGGNEFVEYDGMVAPAIRGELFLWTYRGMYNKVKDAGAVIINLASRNEKGTRAEPIASSDIQTTTGIVHSLNYDFKFRNF
ncbi:hypothetical protein [Gabonibacter chumensis]|uniref:hypothetical protein n=1 Tax=Gabonibacter chumensis TaxID=2972474 RepID=UPI0025723782|nr:hypothetical protein [Gabonibacter chumensis]MCR9011406.1 hypothetical protein [Gabonibacter chumensis]